MKNLFKILILSLLGFIFSHSIQEKQIEELEKQILELRLEERERNSTINVNYIREYGGKYYSPFSKKPYTGYYFELFEEDGHLMIWGYCKKGIMVFQDKYFQKRKYGIDEIEYIYSKNTELYDENGNLVKISYYDENGELTDEHIINP